MKSIIILACCVFCVTIAAPDGYFKQEYQFKKSSATYKNNQLQTQDQDHGFYAKQGDLDGMVKPSVDQGNEHFEYVNPNVDGVGHSVTTYNDRDLTPEAERVFADHKLYLGNNAGHASRSYSYSSSHRTSAATDGGYAPVYNTQSNLRQITQNVEHDLSQQLLAAIYNTQRQTGSSYTTQMRNDDFRLLENELRANISRHLDDALYKQYGNQARKGSFSYSVSSTGTYSPTANYDNQELNDLKKRLEDNLVKELQDKMSSAYSFSRSHSSSSHSTNTAYDDSNLQQRRDSAEIDDLNRHTLHPKPTYHNAPTYRPYRPSINYNTEDWTTKPQKVTYATQYEGSNTQGSYFIPETTTYRSYYTNRGIHSTQYRPSSYNDHYVHPTTERVIVNPHVKIVDVVQNVQNDLSRQLHESLKAYEEKYSSDSYTITNARPDYQSALDNFKRELKANLTRMIHDELERNYGQQTVRGDYSFSQSSHTNANYRIDDLESLRQQADNNLLKFLEDTFRQQENRYISKKQSNSYSSRRDYSHNAPTYTQALTDDNTRYYRPTSYISPSSTHSSQSSYSSSYSSGGVSGQSSADLQQLKNQLREDLNRQLQDAIHKQQTSSASTSYVYSTSGNQAVIQELSDELKQNLTRKLEETLREHQAQHGVRGGSYTVSASGVYYPNSNYRTEDINALSQQLQDELTRKLKEQLNQQHQQQQQQHSQSYQNSFGGYATDYSSSRPYSSPHSGIKTSGLQKYEQFSASHSQSHGSMNGMDEDCMQGDDPSAYQQQIEDFDDLLQQNEDFNGNNQFGGQQNVDYNYYQDLQQKVENMGETFEDLGQIRDDANMEELFQHPVDELASINNYQSYYNPQGYQIDALTKHTDDINTQTATEQANFIQGQIHEDLFNKTHINKLGKDEETTENVMSVNKIENSFSKPKKNKKVDSYDYIDLKTEENQNNFPKDDIVIYLNRNKTEKPIENAFDAQTQNNKSNGQEVIDLGQQIEDDSFLDLVPSSELIENKRAIDNSNKNNDLVLKPIHLEFGQLDDDFWNKLDNAKMSDNEPIGQQQEETDMYDKYWNQFEETNQQIEDIRSPNTQANGWKPFGHPDVGNPVYVNPIYIPSTYNSRHYTQPLTYNRQTPYSSTDERNIEQDIMENGQFLDALQKPEEILPPMHAGAISLADAHRAYISRPQYANAPRDIQFASNVQTENEIEDDVLEKATTVKYAFMHKPKQTQFDVTNEMHNLPEDQTVNDYQQKLEIINPTNNQQGRTLSDNSDSQLVEITPELVSTEETQEGEPILINIIDDETTEGPKIKNMFKKLASKINTKLKYIQDKANKLMEKINM